MTLSAPPGRRGPPARRDQVRREAAETSKIGSAHEYQDGQDFEPIPLNRIAAIPILSSAANTSSSYGGAFSRASSLGNSFPSPQAVGSSGPVAPPMPQSTPAVRRQHRVLEPSSSGSNESSNTSSWERRFSELVDFKRAHGHCEVPQNYSENCSLGTWVNKVRDSVNHPAHLTPIIYY